MKAAILGAGVAGVSSAIALVQKGFDVEIFERHETSATIGAGIVIWPNAAYVLEQLEVLDEIKQVSGQPSCMCRVSNNGEELGAIDIRVINQHMGYPSLSILRRDLQNILIDRLESLGVHIQYGHTVIGIDTGDNGDALVNFQSGECTTADIIIGADGRMASCAREYVMGDKTPIYQGFVNWIGVFESSEPCFTEAEIKDYWGTGERFGIVPVTPYTAYWAGGSAASEIGPRIREEYKKELFDLFGEWPQPIQTIIEQTPTERINKIFVHDHNPKPIWHRQNVIAIGDAAHAPLPTSGQGACQALEDAWQLSNSLSLHSNNIALAFEHFTSLRFEKTTGIIMAGRTLATSLFNPDEQFCKARNEASKQTDYTAMAAAMAHGWSQHLPLNA
ncbi:MAG: FAD-dependent monooxygenase [Gammaproteobacteria bacterium]|nr:FAD-dependent monooxygenase [Gammaproteobacteria bacterium]